jgi:starvation-inducible DNA-binding protein
MTVWVNRNEGRQVVAQRGSVSKAEHEMMDVEDEMPVDPQMLISALRVLLADVISMSLRAQGFHWNVRGADFAQYHELFGAIYEDVYGSVDGVAENILKSGGVAPFRLPELMALRTIVDVPVASPLPADLAADLLAANDVVLASLKMAYEVAGDVESEGVENFIAERIDQHDKWRWQLSASIA